MMPCIVTMASRLRLLTAVCWCAAAFAQPHPGAALYRQNCQSCHGRGGEGGRAPSLTGRLRAGESDADMLRVVSNGIAGTEMASYSIRLGNEKIAQIVAYVRSVKRESAALSGDAARGEALFWGKGGCGGCHAVAGRG